MPKERKKSSTMSFKSIYPIAEFPTSRKSLDLLKKCPLSVSELFPDKIKLTGNELKVLIILKASAIKNSNIAAIDQTQIANLTKLRQPHVARAIVGLRKKGLLIKTWMEEGYKTYRNIYALSVPRELLERDAEKQTLRKEKAKDLENKAEEIKNQCPEDKEKKKQAKRLIKRANAHKEKVCVTCKGEAMLPKYNPIQDIQKWRWCSCSLARLGAQETGTSLSDWVDPEIVTMFLAKRKVALKG